MVELWVKLSIEFSQYGGLCMNPIHVSEDIISLSDFKNNASKMLHQVQDTNRPMVITQNGRPAAVLMSPAEYDMIIEQTRFVQAVQNGLDDIEHGRVLSDDELDKDLDETALD